jgi:hypothetical protein
MPEKTTVPFLLFGGGFVFEVIEQTRNDHRGVAAVAYKGQIDPVTL